MLLSSKEVRQNRRGKDIEKAKLAEHANPFPALGQGVSPSFRQDKGSFYQSLKSRPDRV